MARAVFCPAVSVGRREVRLRVVVVVSAVRSFTGPSGLTTRDPSDVGPPPRPARRFPEHDLGTRTSRAKVFSAERDRGSRQGTTGRSSRPRARSPISKPCRPKVSSNQAGDPRPVRRWFDTQEGRRPARPGRFPRSVPRGGEPGRLRPGWEPRPPDRPVSLWQAILARSLLEAPPAEAVRPVCWRICVLISRATDRKPLEPGKYSLRSRKHSSARWVRAGRCNPGRGPDFATDLAVAFVA